MLISLVSGLTRAAVDADAVLAVVGIGVHDGPEVGKLEAQDDVGIADRRGRTAEIVGLGEVHAAALIDDPRLQELGQLDQKPHAVLGARRTIGDDHRILRVGEQPRRFLDGAGIALRRRARHIARNIELLAVVLDRLLLNAGVERDCHRSVRRRHRDLVGAHERLRVVLQADRRVVPLGEVAHQRVDVLRGVEGRHARRPMGGVEVVAADHDDRHPVAPGIVDAHGGVLQADGAVAQRHQRLAGDLEVAVRHADRGFLVRAGEVFRHLVAAVVDQRLVDGAEAGGAVRGAVFDVERLDHVDHEVRAGDAADPGQLLRRCGLGRRHVHVGRERRWPPRRLRIRQGRRRRAVRYRGRDRSGGTRHRDARQELAPVHLRTRIFSCHGALP